MKRLDSRTVEFTTDVETQAYDLYQERLSAGDSICIAAATALEEVGLQMRFTGPFVEYLSEDTLIVVGDRARPRLVMTGFGGKVEGFTPTGQAQVNRLVREGRSFAEAVAHVRGGPAMVLS